jgi:hypothetical protein
LINQREFISRLIAHLGVSEIPYMLCRSVASSFHGEPRATKDIDLVIDCSRQQLPGLLQRIHSAGWYVSDDAAMEAVQQRGMFNVIDPDSGWKADLIVRRDRAFSICEFERRQTAAVLGDAYPTVILTTPEDTILSKLEWSRGSHSEQQYRDALQVAVVGHERLDSEYLKQWAKTIGVGEVLEKLLAAADEQSG